MSAYCLFPLPCTISDSVTIDCTTTAPFTVPKTEVDAVTTNVQYLANEYSKTHSHFMYCLLKSIDETTIKIIPIDYIQTELFNGTNIQTTGFIAPSVSTEDFEVFLVVIAELWLYKTIYQAKYDKCIDTMHSDVYQQVSAYAELIKSKLHVAEEKYIEDVKYFKDLASMQLSILNHYKDEWYAVQQERDDYKTKYYALLNGETDGDESDNQSTDCGTDTNTIIEDTGVPVLFIFWLVFIGAGIACMLVEYSVI